MVCNLKFSFTGKFTLSTTSFESVFFPLQYTSRKWRSSLSWMPSFLFSFHWAHALKEELRCRVTGLTENGRLASYFNHQLSGGYSMEFCSKLEPIWTVSEAKRNMRHFISIYQVTWDRTHDAHEMRDFSNCSAQGVAQTLQSMWQFLKLERPSL